MVRCFPKSDAETKTQMAGEMQEDAECLVLRKKQVAESKQKLNSCFVVFYKYSNK